MRPVLVMYSADLQEAWDMFLCNGGATVIALVVNYLPAARGRAGCSVGCSNLCVCYTLPR